MSGVKRQMTDQDPDYEDVAPKDPKRQRIYEEGAKEMTIRRIENIVCKEFSQEKNYKESEIMLIDERLQQARIMADRLRACIVASFYSKAGQNLEQIKTNRQAIHPAVKKHLGKAPVNPVPSNGTKDNSQKKKCLETVNKVSKNASMKTEEVKGQGSEKSKHQEKQSTTKQLEHGHVSRFKVKKRIIVGNVSKYIPVEKRESSDRSTHRWMMYVRGPSEEPNIDDFVEKVWFFLHPSYRPHDLVEIKERPFHLTRRGWGEFPVRVQLHFKDKRNKRVDIIHILKLDKTYTGLQTLGAETVVDVELERDSVGLPLEQMLQNSSRQTPPIVPSLLESYSASKDYGIKDTPIRCEAIIKTEPDLSLVKSEPNDDSTPRPPTVTTPEVFVKEEPMSPPRTVTPVKMVLGGLGSSPVHINNSKPRATTPVKEGEGWTRIQIKSEPTSPAENPNKKGWQNISSFTSPVKVENTELNQTGHASSNTSPILAVPMNISPGPIQSPNHSNQMQASNMQNTFLHLVPAQGAVPPSTEQNKKVAPPTIQKQMIQSGQFISISPQPVTRHISPTIRQQRMPARMVSPASSPTFKNPTQPVGTSAARSSQPTVYIRCHDKQGKVYLIPQHVLSKTPGVIASANSLARLASSPVSASMTGTLPSILATQTSTQKLAKSGSSPLAIAPSVKQPTSSTKNTGKTLTYVIAPTDSGSAAQKLIVAGNQNSQKMAFTSPAGPAKSLLISPKTSGTNTIIAIPSEQNTITGNSVSSSATVKNKPSLQAGRTVQSGALITNLTGSTSETNLNIAGKQQRQSFVIINQNQVQTPIPKASNLADSSPVSLLSKFTNIKPNIGRGKPLSNEVGILKQASQAVSLLSKGSSSQTKSSPTSTVIIKQEAESSTVLDSKTLSLGGLAGQTQVRQTPLLLVPSRPQVRPTVQNQRLILAPSQTQESRHSILTNVGNQNLLVQVLPQKQTEPLVQSIKEEPETATQSKEHSIMKHSSKRTKPEGHDRTNRPNESRKFQTHKGPDIRTVDYYSMEELVQAVVRHYPLIKENEDRSIHPYCAQNEQEFFSWKIGKRRAAEWSRVCAIHRKLCDVLYLEEVTSESYGQTLKKYSFHGEPLWTKKKLLWWCRNHLFSPWDSGLLGLLKKIPDKEKEEHKDLVQDLCSYSDAKDLIETLGRETEEVPKEQNESEEEEIIDIMGEETKTPAKTNTVSPLKSPTADKRIHLDPGPEDYYIRDVVSQIGIQLKSVEIDPADAPDVYSSVVEQMVMRVTKRLMEDLLRKTRALQLMEKRKEDNLTSLDVFHAIESLPNCSFLTNFGLGSLISDPSTRSHPAA